MGHSPKCLKCSVETQAARLRGSELTENEVCPRCDREHSIVSVDNPVVISAQFFLVGFRVSVYSSLKKIEAVCKRFRHIYNFPKVAFLHFFSEDLTLTVSTSASVTTTTVWLIKQSHADTFFALQTTGEGDCFGSSRYTKHGEVSCLVDQALFAFFLSSAYFFFPSLSFVR
jgi:hypothetical protein